MRFWHISALLTLALTFSSGASLLSNSSLEIQCDSEDTADSWCDNISGGMWGNAIRSDWQSYQGNHSAAIRGAWSGLDNGGCWQACLVTPNTAYEASAQFYWDNAWSAEKIEWRVEWYRDDELLSVDRQQISDLPESEWSLRLFSVEAPVMANRAHFVLDVSETSPRCLVH